MAFLLWRNDLGDKLRLRGGFAAAHGGKPLAFRSASLTRLSLEAEPPAK